MSALKYENHLERNANKYLFLKVDSTSLINYWCKIYWTELKTLHYWNCNYLTASKMRWYNYVHKHSNRNFKSLKKQLKEVQKSNILNIWLLVISLFPAQKSKGEIPLLSSGISALRWENHLEKMPLNNFYQKELYVSDPILMQNILNITQTSPLLKLQLSSSLQKLLI